MKYCIGVAIHDENRAKQVLKTFNFVSEHSFDLFLVYSHDDPKEPILRVLTNYNFVVRPNEGADYGAARDLFCLKKGQYDRFVFLNDDVIFVRDNWLDAFHEAFELGADVVSPCVCTNFKGRLVPRGCFWSATSKFLQELPWSRPITKEDACEQEMNLLPDFMEKTNSTMYQIGNGDNLMYVEEYPPGKTGCSYSYLPDGAILKCPN